MAISYFSKNSQDDTVFMKLYLSENKKDLIIKECTELEYDQLKASLTKKVEGWRFHPLVKKKIRNGDITFLKRNVIPSGLWKEVIDICKDYDFSLSVEHIKGIFDEDINRNECAFTS